MPHVSSKKLDELHLDFLYKEFIKSLAQCVEEGKSQAALGQFFTRTEKEMFAKRLAVIAMLSKGIARSTIANTLKMSPVTIDTMQVKYEAGKYDWVIKSALREKDIWYVLEKIIDNLNTAGGVLPPRIKRRK